MDTLKVFQSLDHTGEVSKGKFLLYLLRTNSRSVEMLDAGIGTVVHENQNYFLEQAGEQAEEQAGGVRLETGGGTLRGRGEA